MAFKGKKELSLLKGPPIRSNSVPKLPTYMSSSNSDSYSFQSDYNNDKLSSLASYKDFLELGFIPVSMEDISLVRKVLKAIKQVHLNDSQKAMLTSILSIISEQTLRLNNNGQVDFGEPLGSLPYHSILQREGIDMSNHALQQLLDREVELLESKVEQVGRQIDPKKHWTEIAQDLKQKHPATKEQVFSAYQEQIQRAKNFIDRKQLIDLPDQDAEVVQTPPGAPRDIPFSVCPASYYYPLRQMEVNWSDNPKALSSVLAAHYKARLPLVTVHELYPGHHTAMTASHKQEPTSLEKMVGALSFFNEGWATYSEKLMLEQGFFKKPEERFYALLHHLSQADKARRSLLIHTGGDLSGITEEQRAHHLDRGIDLAAYYLGMLQIERLRKQVMCQFPQMTLREFHNRLVQTPEMPLPQMAKVAFGIDFDPLTDVDSLDGAGAASYPLMSDSKEGKGPFAKTLDNKLQAVSLP